VSIAKKRAILNQKVAGLKLLTAFVYLFMEVFDAAFLRFFENRNAVL